MSDHDDDRATRVDEAADTVLGWPMRQYDKLPLMLGVSDLAELWDCSERVASDWCAENAWHPDTQAGVAFKVGRAWRVPRDAVIPPPAGLPEVDQLRAETSASANVWPRWRACWRRSKRPRRQRRTPHHDHARRLPAPLTR